MSNTYKLKIITNVWIVGCGGIGSYAIAPILKLLKHGCANPPIVKLIDGDILEDRNLDRQLFNATQIGKNKAEALADTHRAFYPRIEVVPDYLDLFHEVVGTSVPNVIFCFADNHPCRKNVLQLCDTLETTAILAGNAMTDEDAYIYKGKKFVGLNDPRVRFPEILTSEAGDPIQPLGCASEAALAAEPQLASANFIAAAFALKLFVLHFSNEFAEVPDDCKATMYHSNFNRIISVNHVNS